MEAQKTLIPPLRRDLQLIPGAKNMIFDPAADTYYKVSGTILKIIGVMTERTSFPDFQQKLAANGICVSDRELMSIIAFLRQNNLLVPEYGEITAKRKVMENIKERTWLLRFSAAYLFFRLPPWRPEKFFEKAAPYLSFLASKWFLLLLLIPALAGYAGVLKEFTSVKATFIDSLSWAGMVKYFFAIIALKFIHEAAHSIAAMHFNCRVRGIGLGFMVFYPRLYTDTTDSWKLPRSQRLLIDGAGIIIELLLGGIAALLWFELPPGVWKYTMFYVFTVSTLSTLLVNGNPLIRYDGYYILCDLLNIENLMSRSAEYIKQCWRWYFFRLGKKTVSEHRRIFFIFGISSFIYRIFLYTSIILVLYHSFAKVLAVILIILELYSLLFYPCFREIKTIAALAGQSGKSTALLLGAGQLLILAGILFIPFPRNIVLPGETAFESCLQVTLPVSGYLCRELPFREKKVKKNETLLTLESPSLSFAAENLQKKNDYEKILYFLQQMDEKRFSESLVTAEKIKSNKLALQELARQQQQLTVKAVADGHWKVNFQTLSKGAFLARGTVVGEIVSGKQIVYAYADDQQIGEILENAPAKIYVGDQLNSFSARVTAIENITVKLENTPVLQIYGGTLPVVFDEKNNKYVSAGTIYRITLEPDGNTGVFSGRKTTVKILKNVQLYRVIKNWLLLKFKKEFVTACRERNGVLHG